MSDPEKPEKEVPKVSLTPASVIIILVAGITAITISVIVTLFPTIVTFTLLTFFPEWTP